MLEKTLSGKLLEHITWRNLSRIQEIAEWSDSELAERLNLTVRELLKNRAMRRPVLVAPLISLAESLEISADSLLFGKLDYVALEKHLHGDWDYIPEKYCVAARSSRDMVRNLLAYNTAKHGVVSSMRLLRPFQIKYNAILNGHSPINLRLSTEIAQALSPQSNEITIGTAIGSNAATFFEGSAFQKELNEAKPKTVLDVFATSGKLAGKYLEDNLTWEAERTSSHSFIFSGEPNKEVFRSLDEDLVRSKLASGVRFGFMHALTPIAKLKALFSIKIIRCLSQGDSSIRYEVNWSSLT